MNKALRIADTQPTACKICSGPSPLFGVVEFHKSCIEAQGKRLRLSGIPVYFRRCDDCAFVFTDGFDAWTPQEMQERVYNADYLFVDPDYVLRRPSGNAQMVAQTFPGARGSMRILDYGGGSGVLADCLRTQHFQATTYDPFSAEFNQLPADQFDLLTCFEVMEHAVFPQQVVATMAGLMKPGGAILFSTLLQPVPFESIGLNWWYASPRNGHVSLYSPAALARLFALHQLRVASFSPGLHFAYKNVPWFATHLNLPA
jgi:2-polyprenyl-6-hydroxyphenyl methylase/3-demethylubiquinone-9 3-methyltransferase